MNLTCVSQIHPLHQCNTSYTLSVTLHHAVVTVYLIVSFLSCLYALFPGSVSTEAFSRLKLQFCSFVWGVQLLLLFLIFVWSPYVHELQTVFAFDGCYIRQLTCAVCSNESVPIHSLLLRCAAYSAGNSVVSRFVPVHFGPRHYVVFCSYWVMVCVCCSSVLRCACHCCRLIVELVTQCVWQ